MKNKTLSQPHCAQDIWQRLSCEKRPIVLYGMGRGADKILRVCKRYGIEISDFFASDGFVRGHSFHGKTVLSYSEISRKYRDFVVLLSFATSRPDVLDTINQINSEVTLLCPDVPVADDDDALFTREYYDENAEALNEIYQSFADDESRRILECVINYKLCGEISYLTCAQSSHDEISKNILSYHRYKTYIDLGAYHGDTVRDVISKSPGLRQVIAFEPDARTYRKLAAYAASVRTPLIHTYNIAAWDKEETLLFSSGGGRNSAVFSGTADVRRDVKRISINADSVDHICDITQARADLIKYDVEGAEQKALSGSEKTIKQYSPDLVISLYHRTDDLITLPALVKKLNPEYNLYLRRFRGVPAWDLNLYAVK